MAVHKVDDTGKLKVPGLRNGLVTFCLAKETGALSH